ncbi:hypothetical protein DOTSEDRAFT_37404 [Dothistroma septosporum NZE10]|uniref:Uncharacterized protein n=1 Tax=Dothistroma septosporum (strain NZE10 / CBS 128990) TaxID=675120 RepID=N1PET0_DOTSN|nr:hypothetical protein DOTSEDRAFT_37404 [Dothistroma septosporum NZE10]
MGAIAIYITPIALSIFGACFARRLERTGKWSEVFLAVRLLPAIYVDLFLFVLSTAIIKDMISTSAPCFVIVEMLLCQCQCRQHTSLYGIKTSLLGLTSCRSTEVLIYISFRDKAWGSRGLLRPRVSSKFHSLNFSAMVTPYLAAVEFAFVRRETGIDECVPTLVAFLELDGEATVTPGLAALWIQKILAIVTCRLSRHRRARSTTYSLRTSPSRTKKARDPFSTKDCDPESTNSGTKRKRGSHYSNDSGDGDPAQFSINEVKKRIRRVYCNGENTLPPRNQKLVSLPLPDRLDIYHDFTAGGIPPPELLTDDNRDLWIDDYRQLEPEWALDPETGTVEKRVAMLPLPRQDGTFGAPDYAEQVQGWSLLLKRYCGRSVSPDHTLEPQDMTYKEWEEFARPIGLLLEAVEGFENVYDHVTGK